MKGPPGAGTLRVRATSYGDSVEVRAIVLHPMETGRRTAADGTRVPARYIEKVFCTLDGETVLDADWGPGIARNPSLSFTIRNIGRPGVLRIAWVDNRGGEDAVEVSVGNR